VAYSCLFGIEQILACNH